jgi:hypothetical protein
METTPAPGDESSMVTSSAMMCFSMASATARLSPCVTSTTTSASRRSTVSSATSLPFTEVSAERHALPGESAATSLVVREFSSRTLSAPVSRSTPQWHKSSTAAVCVRARYSDMGWANAAG